MKKINKSKKIINESKSILKQDSNNLYISLNDVSNKRKQLLSSIKDSLVMQEESEKLKEIRKEKFEVLNNIKRNLSLINSNYQKLKKFLPNVKNVISYTEKELDELEIHIQMVKKNINLGNKEILNKENLIQNIGNFSKIKKNSDSKKEKITSKKKLKSKIDNDIPISKVDRIKNNLKVIEAKLNSL